MNNYKKIVIVIACISALVTVYLFSQIYAKYLTSASGNANIPIAKWNIKVNNTSIGSSSSATITPVFAGSSNIAPNVIAPSAEGYFDLALDFTDVEVSFSYEISITANASSAVPDIIATGYSIDGSSTVIPLSNSSKISENILYSSNITSRTIRVYIKWDDNASTQSMNNIQDTAVVTQSTDSQILINANIAFTQLLNS